MQESVLFGYFAVAKQNSITIGKNCHFSGQSHYCQVIKLLDKSNVLQFSREHGGERYPKGFNCWIHLVVMLYVNAYRVLLTRARQGMVIYIPEDSTRFPAFYDSTYHYLKNTIRVKEI